MKRIRTKSMNRAIALYAALLLAPLAIVHAAEAAKPAAGITQQLLNGIHITPKLILDPFPAYEQKFLPFAMAASMEATSKGRLWTCWAGGQDGPNAYLLASYSDDQGKSWRDPVFVIDPQAHGLPMGTRLGSFWCDPKERLWLFFHQSCGMFDGSCSNWFVRCDDPDAEKPAWTAPVYIGFGASLNKPIVRKNGEWILPVSLWERWHIDEPFADYYHELDAVRGADVFVSDDEGASWRYRGGNIFVDSCFNEHSVVEKQDGTLWMLSRCKQDIAQTFSTDGGKTWQPQTTFFPHVNSKAVFRRLKSGSILLVRHGGDLTQATPSRRELTAFLSSDEGKTWSGGLLLDERNDVSYPDIAQAPNGDIYVHYDRDRTGAAEILFARFREEDVKAGKLVSRSAALKNLVKSRQLGMNHGATGKHASSAAPVALMLAPLAVVHAADQAPLDFAVKARIDEFLGEPRFVPMQRLFEGRGGWGGVLTAADGTVIAFRSPGGGTCRRSLDGGLTWSAEIVIGSDANEGNALVDETTGDILSFNPIGRWLYRSRDAGATWAREAIEVRPDGFGLEPGKEGVAAMQCGITLAFGNRKGRLISPARIMGPRDSNAVEWRAYHYSTAIWSDDGGRVWQTSKPFPVLGTGEAALAELSDGSILYNSREHMTRGNRFLATSHDGGDLWLDARRSPDLPDGVRGTSYGCMGGMIRIPVAGHDILLFSNLDSDAGTMPAQVGGSTREGSENVTVWASFDGGRTWPVKRLIHDGPGAYSSLAVGRTGTPSQGKIYVLFEGGPNTWNEAVQVTAFNLSWLLDGRDIATLLGKAAEVPASIRPR